MTRRWLFLSTLLLSCSPGCCGPKFDAYASMDGPSVSVSVHGLEKGDVVTVAGVSQTVEPGEFSARVSIPADKIGAGDQKLEVTLNRGSKTATRTVKLKVPDQALAPQVLLGPCTKEETAIAPTGFDRKTPLEINTDAWTGSHVPGLKNTCNLQADGKAHVQVRSHSDATVSVGGKPVSLQAGAGELAFDLGSLLRGLSLAELTEDDPRRTPVNAALDISVSRAGKSRAYKATLTASRNDLRNALQSSLTGWKARTAMPWPHAPHSGGPRAAVLVTTRVEIQVDGKPDWIINTAYADPVPVGPAAAKADEVDLVARATQVDLTNVGSCTGYNTIYGSGSVRNVGYKTSLEVEVWNEQGAVVAKKKFPAPAKTECPESLSGVQGKTTVLIWMPERKAVVDWVESVRRGAK